MLMDGLHQSEFSSSFSIIGGIWGKAFMLLLLSSFGVLALFLLFCFVLFCFRFFGFCFGLVFAFGKIENEREEREQKRSGKK